MSRYSYLPAFILILALAACQQKVTEPAIPPASSYQELVALFNDWRAFENPPKKDGAPDYTKETFQNRHSDFQFLQKRLLAFDTTGWPIPEKADWMIVWAEMNGYDFNYRVLKPWERDPAFYKAVWMYRSDVPAHEGPTHHATTEVWTYDFPLDPQSREKFLSELKVIVPLNKQARQNLTGNAKDLWIAGIREIQFQSEELASLLELPGVAEDNEIVATIHESIQSTNELVEWLKAESSKKTGPSGIGKENYTWYQQNVHLVPLTWEDEVMILKRELARAWSTLKLEEHRNRNLPPISPADSPEAYDQLADAGATSLIRFLDEQDIVTVKDYFDPALREHLGGFVPADRRNFFWITAHNDPRPLYSHFYHWFELARMDTEPNSSPRSTPSVAWRNLSISHRNRLPTRTIPSPTPNPTGNSTSSAGDAAAAQSRSRRASLNWSIAVRIGTYCPRSSSR